MNLFVTRNELSVLVCDTVVSFTHYECLFRVRHIKEMWNGKLLIQFIIKMAVNMLKH